MSSSMTIFGQFLTNWNAVFSMNNLSFAPHFRLSESRHGVSVKLFGSLLPSPLSRLLSQMLFRFAIRVTRHRAVIFYIRGNFLARKEKEKTPSSGIHNEFLLA